MGPLPCPLGVMPAARGAAEALKSIGARRSAISAGSPACTCAGVGCSPATMPLYWRYSAFACAEAVQSRKRVAAVGVAALFIRPEASSS